jgi:hypothetical protein
MRFYSAFFDALRIAAETDDGVTELDEARDHQFAEKSGRADNAYPRNTRCEPGRLQGANRLRPQQPHGSVITDGEEDTREQFF